MRTWNAVWAICAALAFACAASAQEKVKLEYKLKPGTELVYKISGKESVPSSVPPFLLSGSLRLVVADVDSSGARLVGCQWDTKVSAKSWGILSYEEVSITDRELSICWMDRAGNPIPLKPKQTFLPVVKKPDLLEDRYYQGPDTMTLPAGEVAVGENWNSQTDAMPFIPWQIAPIPAKVASTLAEIKNADGHQCALIESSFSPGMPEIAVTGDAKTLFDIDGGFSRKVAMTLVRKSTRNDADKKVEHTHTWEITLTLDSMKTLPENQAAAVAQGLKTVEEVLAARDGGDFANADAAIARLRTEELPKAWLAGFEDAVAALRTRVPPTFVK